MHVCAIVFDFLSSYALMLSEWADRTERYLAEGAADHDRRTELALHVIRSRLASYPDRDEGQNRQRSA